MKIDDAIKVLTQAKRNAEASLRAHSKGSYPNPNGIEDATRKRDAYGLAIECVKAVGQVAKLRVDWLDFWPELARYFREPATKVGRDLARLPRDYAAKVRPRFNTIPPGELPEAWKPFTTGHTYSGASCSTCASVDGCKVARRDAPIVPEPPVISIDMARRRKTMRPATKEKAMPVTPLDLRCPSCLSSPGAGCTKNAEDLTEVKMHKARRLAFAKRFFCPTCEAEPGRDCFTHKGYGERLRSCHGSRWRAAGLD